jgi:hypothetical protein
MEWSNKIAKFAVTSRRPAFVRWAEEAEAKQVCERAGLDHAYNRPGIGNERSRGVGERGSLLRRLRGLLGNQIARI